MMDAGWPMDLGLLAAGLRDVPVEQVVVWR